MIIECIKDGVILTNRNLHLVLIRVVVSLINIIAAGIFLGIPLIVAVAYFGFDIAHARDLLPYVAENPVEFLSRYLGLALLMLLALTVFLVFLSLISIYILAGTLGTLRTSCVNPVLRFSLPSFFREANTHFSRLFWVLSLVFFGVSCVLIICVLAGGITVLFLSGVPAGEGTLTMFFRSFTAVFVITLCVAALIGSIIFSVYSAVISVVEEKRSMATVKSTYAFLINNPQALLFFLAVTASFIAANLVFFSVQIPLKIVPLMNLLSFLFDTVFGAYLGVALWGSLVTYYMRVSAQPVHDAEYVI